MIGIYSITNLNNNKIYIGSSKALKRRKYEHFYLLRIGKHHNLHLQNAYNKYGKQSFVFSIIEECALEYLYIREEYWIKYYNTLEDNYGYNDCIVEKSSHYFQQHTKDKMSRSNKSKKKVYQYNLNGNLLNIFGSVKECARFLNIDRRFIQHVLKHTNKTAYGFYFSFGEFDYIPIINPLNAYKPICKYTLNNEYICSYISIKQASIDNNIIYTNLSRHLNGHPKCKTIGGFIYKYQDYQSR